MGSRHQKVGSNVGLMFRQRLTLSLLALSRPDVDGLLGKYTCKQLARSLSASPIRKFAVDLTQEELAAFLESGWNFEYELQKRQLEVLAKHSSDLRVLDGLADLRSAAKWPRAPGCCVLTLARSLLALEWDVNDRQLFLVSAKRNCAKRILRDLHDKLKPTIDRSVSFPDLALAPVLRRLVPLSNRIAQDAGFKFGASSSDCSFSAVTVKVSSAVAKRFPEQPGEELLDYLLSLAFDREPLHPRARLRWAMDLCSCVLALHSLQLCTAHERDLTEAERNRSDMHLGLLKLLWDGSRGADWVLAARAVARLHLLEDGRERRLRALMGSATIDDSAVRLRYLLKTLAIDSDWLWTAWKRATEPAGKTSHEMRSNTNSFARLRRYPSHGHRLLTTSQGLRRAINFVFRRQRLRTPSTSTDETLSRVHDSFRPFSPEELTTLQAASRLAMRETAKIRQRAHNQGRSLARADYEKIQLKLEQPARRLRRTRRSRQRCNAQSPAGAVPPSDAASSADTAVAIGDTLP